MSSSCARCSPASTTSYDAICEIHSGAGGTDAQDWAEMLLRMYLPLGRAPRASTSSSRSVSEGQEAGISSATFMVKGRYAYGLLRAEHGVHRLVRISPVQRPAHAARPPSPALKVTPFLEDVPTSIIDDKDLRIDTYRSSGAGGQHVNVTDSAVRITHLPTGIVVVLPERAQPAPEQGPGHAGRCEAKLADLHARSATRS